MIKVDQQTGTDCLRACVASLLDMQLDDVPDFGTSEGQWMRFERFMALESLRPLGIPPGRFSPPYNAYYLIHGLSPRMVRHSVIGLNGMMVHDPHPSRAGLESVEQYVVFLAFLHEG